MNAEYVTNKTVAALARGKDSARRRTDLPGQNPKQNDAPHHDLYHGENRLNPLASLQAQNQFRSQALEHRPDLPLAGKRIAILVANGFEEIEMDLPRRAFEQAGATAAIVSPEGKVVTSWNQTKRGTQFNVDLPLRAAHAEDFDALLLPGGVTSSEKLRDLPEAAEFVRGFARRGKPVAAICHGPGLLLEAGAAKGRRLTSYGGLKSELKKAGADWLEQPVVVDHELVTGRQVADLARFVEAARHVFEESFHPELHSV